MSTSSGSAPDPAPDFTTTYADHPCGVLDVHLPPAARTGGSVVLLVHGGFWRAAWDRTHTRPQARALAELGHVVVTPEYRRTGEGPGGGGGWPTTGDDVRRALDAVPSVLEGHLDGPVGRLTAMGHSAGGHLALWLAATGAPLDHVVALAPVGDLREAQRLGLGDGAVDALLAGADSEEAAAADPAELLDHRPAGSVTVVHGTHDEAVPLSLSRGLVARHPWIALREVDADHMALIDPASPVWGAVVDALGPTRARRSEAG